MSRSTLTRLIARAMGALALCVTAAVTPASAVAPEPPPEGPAAPGQQPSPKTLDAPTPADPEKPPAPAAIPSDPNRPSMVLVPAGDFQMGSPEENQDAPSEEKPQHLVTLKAFRIDRYEVTNAEYGKFLDAIRSDHPKTCAPEEPPMKDHTPDLRFWNDPEWNAAEKPVCGVDWYDAFAYCAWAGKRLPTEAEWEKAARGTDMRLYPWGNEPPGKTLVGNFADESVKKINPKWKVISGYDDGFPLTAPVGSFPKGASPYGVEDMAGNVWEWVADYFSRTAYEDQNIVDPKGPAKGDTRTLRGGSWDSTSNLLRATARHTQVPTYRGISFGFRCAQDAP